MSSISILMATYNGGQFLDSQLESLAVQSKLPSEVIVSDDCSTDDTISIVKRFIKHSPFPVHVYRNKYTKGYRHNFIDAMMLCTSSLIAFCDQDDVWHKDKLLLVSERFKEGSPLLVHHNARVVDSVGNFIGVLWPKDSLPYSGDLLMTGPWSYSLGFTQVFRRDLLWFRYLWDWSIDCNFPNERLAHDQWVFFLSAVLGKIAYIDQALVDYRQHDNNLYGVGWDISVVNGKKTKQKGSSSWLKNLPYIFDEDGERFCRLANIADNRVGILDKIVRDEVYLPIIRQRAMVALSQYSALAERFYLRARIYQRVEFINRFVAWLKLIRVRAYRFDRLWWFSVKAAARDALVGVLLGPGVRVVKSGFYKFRSRDSGSLGTLGE
jgi:glycosyltransferase involved in cell wall biosynthesis